MWARLVWRTVRLFSVTRNNTVMSVLTCEVLCICRCIYRLNCWARGYLHLYFEIDKFFFMNIEPLQYTPTSNAGGNICFCSAIFPPKDPCLSVLPSNLNTPVYNTVLSLRKCWFDDWWLRLVQISQRLNLTLKTTS